MTSEICALCASGQPGGELAFRREHHSHGETWVAGPLLASTRMCPTCFRWADSLMDTAASGEGATNLLGLPGRVEGTHRDPRRCAYCHSALGSEAFALDLVPTGRPLLRTALLRSFGPVRQQRICRQCHAWWRVTLAHPASIQGLSWRQAEGGPGGWVASASFDVLAEGLGARDLEILTRTVTSMGHQAAVVPSVAAVAPLEPRAVLFVAANRRNRAAMAAASLDPADRGRLCVVATPETLADALEAMRLGAGDFVASPLSPQQVTGAFDRINEPEPGLRDVETGLPLAGTHQAHDRFGFPANAIDVQLPGGEDPGQAALLVRRYVRGYDRIAVHGRGGLRVTAYCPPEHAATVAARLVLVLGERARATVQATAVNRAA